LTAANIYQQSLDKQRIVIVGEGNDLITSMITHVLKSYDRRFDLVSVGHPALISNTSPIIIIQATDQLIDYKHHIAILSEAGSESDLKLFEQLADETPKGGTLIYPEFHPALKQIGSKERTDVQTIAYTKFKHEGKEGETLLISSTGERVPVALHTDRQLTYASAAKELLKKVGISSGQFYRSISTYIPA
jgi:UDP-N-acetylmuramate: L-alanyl-gamma-D-glutamyl-meso-diaminopimelate ligase